VVYDAGETLGLLPVAHRLRSSGTAVRWIPLTPWSADLLATHDETFLALPDRIDRMPHVESRRGASDPDPWLEALLADPPGLAVLGMVSTVQGMIARRLHQAGIPTRGFHDGFQPPGPESITAETAPSFEEVWVSSPRVREGYRALGLETAVVGQPSLESWRRAADEVDLADVRRRQGARDGDRLLTFAGQYGPGYGEALASFLGAVRETLSVDSSLVLVLSPHPRTDGAEEREALERAGIPRAVMASEGLSTMELAAASEVVLTWTSTVGTQAAFMGKQVIYHAPPADFDASLVELGAASWATSSDLGSVLSEALRNGAPPEAIRERLVAGGYVLDADRVMAMRIREVLEGR
jgi:hypothetical protein